MKKETKTVLKVAGVTLLVGVGAGVGIKIGYDKIFKTVAKSPTLTYGPIADKGIKFIAHGKNIFGKEVVEAIGYIDIPNWVGTFMDSMASEQIGSKICEELLRQLPDISKIDPKVLKEAGIELTKF